MLASLTSSHHLPPPTDLPPSTATPLWKIEDSPHHSFTAPTTTAPTTASSPSPPLPHHCGKSKTVLKNCRASSLKSSLSRDKPERLLLGVLPLLLGLGGRGADGALALGMVEGSEGEEEDEGGMF